MFKVIIFYRIQFLQISLVTSVSIEVSLGYANPDEAITFIELQKFGTVAALKVLLFRFYRKNLADIIISATKDWCSSINPKFLGIMKGYESLGNTVFYAQAITNFVQLFFLMLGNLPTLAKSVRNNSTNTSNDIYDERVFLLGTKCLLGNYSTTTYLLIYILQLFQCYSTAFGNIGIDVFFFTLAMHICGQLEILYHEMSDFTLENNWKATKLRIVAFIKRHQHLLKEAQMLETTFSLAILIQVVINITGICSFGKSFYFHSI